VSLIEYKNFNLLLILLIISCISMFYYVRIIQYILFPKKNFLKFIFINKNNLKIIIIGSLVSFTYILFPWLFLDLLFYEIIKFNIK
jgi:NADH:ubiquinone oxidoreductase subunit 2 (subunit N)